MPPDLRVAFWNVQNLFVPGANDRAPKNELQLNARLDSLAAVVNELFDNTGPSLLGLCEIQTEDLLKALVSRLSPSASSFITAWVPCEDSTQTGLAIVARADQIGSLKVLDAQRPTAMARPRSAIAEVSVGAITFLFVVNHWKSRMVRGGIDPASDRGETASWIAARLADRAKDPNPPACAIVVGDFNAEPYEKAFLEHHLRSTRFFSRALRQGLSPYLYNTAWRLLSEPDFAEEHDPKKPQPRPTTSHDRDRLILDQLLVTGSALREGPIRLKERTVCYHTGKRNTAWKTTGRAIPDRWRIETTGDASGVSDHFPITARFTLE